MAHMFPKFGEHVLAAAGTVCDTHCPKHYQNFAFAQTQYPNESLGVFNERLAVLFSIYDTNIKRLTQKLC